MAAGGKRTGAGRKPGAKNLAQRVAIDVAAQVLEKVNAVSIWAKLLKSEDEKIRVDVMKYLTDRVHGKPAQRIEGNPDKPIAIVLKWGTPVEW